MKYILFINLAGIKYIRYLSNIQDKVVNKLTNDIRAVKIEVEGLVQGVGFRPFVYRLARQYNCNGYVLNKTDGVLIKIEGISAKNEATMFRFKGNQKQTSE